MVTVPELAVASVMINVSPSMSASLASALIMTLLSSLTLAWSLFATGASLIETITTVTVAVSVPPEPSLIV